MGRVFGVGIGLVVWGFEVVGVVEESNGFTVGVFRVFVELGFLWF